MHSGLQVYARYDSGGRFRVITSFPTTRISWAGGWCHSVWREHHTCAHCCISSPEPSTWPMADTRSESEGQSHGDPWSLCSPLKNNSQTLLCLPGPDQGAVKGGLCGGQALQMTRPQGPARRGWQAAVMSGTLTAAGSAVSGERRPPLELFMLSPTQSPFHPLP